ncbi:hypothetical protein [Secundilactobacillus yichangensis]|uniref:hypothetical protein n=1 Tax=Secundilactobacillus yichangensis TaxID=2799580 RepID=UPI001943F18B|nr:hypothetical protein [Secundilactobacillus yichangensis]
MRKLTEMDKSILRMLHSGADNKTSKDKLMGGTGLSLRQVQDSIAVLRDYGIPIMASRTPNDSGYYIATSQEELEHGIAQYKKQVATSEKSIATLERIDMQHYLSKAVEQPELWKLIGSDVIEVTTTSDSATFRVKDTL